MKVRADTAVCVGAGQCVVIAPDVFDLDNDGKVVVLDAAPGPAQRAPARDAAESCPSFAITIDDTSARPEDGAAPGDLPHRGG
jgi:ferredoxin